MDLLINPQERENLLDRIHREAEMEKSKAPGA